MTAKVPPIALSGLEMLEQLGAGRTCVVWKVRRSGTSETFAVKLLRSNFNADHDEIARLRREAHIGRVLDHQNIVRTLDLGSVFEHAAGPPYWFAQALAPGPSLAQTMQRRRQPLSEQAVRQVGQSLCQALAYAHAQKPPVIHRDIKPSNICATPNGDVKLMDFGSARAGTQSSITHPLTVVATPEYIAPEYGQTGTALPQSDLYSLGVVLYELATGRLPFLRSQRETDQALVFKHMSCRPPSPRTLRPDLSAEFEQLVMRLLEKDPNRRFESATALSQALRHPVRSHPAPSETGLGPSTRLVPAMQAAQAEPVIEQVSRSAWRGTSDLASQNGSQKRKGGHGLLLGLTLAGILAVVGLVVVLQFTRVGTVVEDKAGQFWHQVNEGPTVKSIVPEEEDEPSPSPGAPLEPLTPKPPTPKPPTPKPPTPKPPTPKPALTRLLNFTAATSWPTDPTDSRASIHHDPALEKARDILDEMYHEAAPKLSRAHSIGEANEVLGEQMYQLEHQLFGSLADKLQMGFPHLQWIHSGVIEVGRDGDWVLVPAFGIGSHEIRRMDYSETYVDDGRLPVVGVDFGDAADFAGRVGMSLPTDLQWRMATFRTSDPETAWNDGSEYVRGERMRFALQRGEETNIDTGGGSTATVWFLIGNVAEWVVLDKESSGCPDCCSSADDDHTDPDHAHFCGLCFDSPDRVRPFQLQPRWKGTGRSTIGFRLALRFADTIRLDRTR